MKQVKTFNLVESIEDYFNITPYMPIMEWISKYINYADDVSAERDRPDFAQYPYQVEPIKQWEDLDCRKHVTVMMSEQMGKTNMFVLGLLWRMVYDPCQSLVVYPSDSKAAEMNEVKLRPLMSHIPGLKEELLKPRAIRQDRYNFSNLKSWFQRSRSEDHFKKL